MCQFDLQNIGIWSKFSICSLRNSLILPLPFLFSFLIQPLITFPIHLMNIEMLLIRCCEIFSSLNPAFLTFITPQSFSPSGTLTLNSHFTQENASFLVTLPFPLSLNQTINWCSQTALIFKPTTKYISLYCCGLQFLQIYH